MYAIFSVIFITHLAPIFKYFALFSAFFCYFLQWQFRLAWLTSVHPKSIHWKGWFYCRKYKEHVLQILMIRDKKNISFQSGSAFSYALCISFICRGHFYNKAIPSRRLYFIAWVIRHTSCEVSHCQVFCTYLSIFFSMFDQIKNYLF